MNSALLQRVKRFQNNKHHTKEAWALGFDEIGIDEEEEEEIRGRLLDRVVGPEEGAVEDASNRTVAHHRKSDDQTTLHPRFSTIFKTPPTKTIPKIQSFPPHLNHTKTPYHKPYIPPNPDTNQLPQHQNPPNHKP
ncbi:hypothetical protein AAG906_004079 [Vitis piasezkii]